MAEDQEDNSLLVNIICLVRKTKHLQDTFLGRGQEYQLLERLTKNDPGRRLVLSFEELQSTRIDELQMELFRLQEEKFGATPSRRSATSSNVSSEPVLRVRSLDLEEGRRRSRADSSGSGEASNVVADSDLNERIDVVLGAYATALRNFETLTQDSLPFESYLKELLPIRYRCLRSILGVFGISVESKALDKLSQLRTDTTWPRACLEICRYCTFALRDSWRNRKSKNVDKSCNKQMANEASKFREIGRAGRIEREDRRIKAQRLVMGICGGVALIGPVILMVLRPGTKTSLITTSVATILFAGVLAVFGNGLRGQDVLAATAAYTAVLVVFIGTASSSG